MASRDSTVMKAAVERSGVDPKVSNKPDLPWQHLMIFEKP